MARIKQKELDNNQFHLKYSIKFKDENNKEEEHRPKYIKIVSRFKV